MSRTTISSVNQGATYSKIVAVAALLIFFVIAAFSCVYIVEPGTRGVKVQLGKVSEEFLPEGFGFKMPFITKIVSVPVKQMTKNIQAPSYSSDLQQVDIKMRVLYRIPERSVVSIYRQYAGDPFESLIVPRVEEALKEVVALQSAEQVVKKREEIKTKMLASARQKLGDILIIEDIAVVDTDLSDQLEAAIEAKMVQEQEAAKAQFVRQKAEIEAQTAVIKAKGEAEAIQIRAQALENNPEIIDLQIVEKWDGRAPMVISLGGNPGEGGSPTNILLPINIQQKQQEADLLNTRSSFSKLFEARP